MRKQNTQKRKGWILVLLQFACIILLLWNNAGPLFKGPGAIFIIFGMVLLLASILSMPATNYSVHPMPSKNGRFIASGPYRLIRHPMYSSVILMSVGFVYNFFTTWKLFILIVLIIILVIKINFEETLLTQQYPDYESYKLETKKLIPYLW